MTKFEYKVVSGYKKDAEVEEELNKLGEEGWEIICSYSILAVGNTVRAAFILKRAKQSL